MKKIITASLITLGLLASPAFAKSGVKVGLLTCHVEGGVGYIIGSSKAADCVYKPAGGGRVEHYSGRIGKLGVDIGVTGRHGHRLGGVRTRQGQARRARRAATPACRRKPPSSAALAPMC